MPKGKILENHNPNWWENRKYTPERMDAARAALRLVIEDGVSVLEAIRRTPLPGGGYLGKHLLVEAYYQAVAAGELAEDPRLLEKIRLKPMRTLSGVTTVTVLTKPYPCPGRCIFCPTDVRMPKSYLPDEPGAMRALQFDFDPFAQVQGRLEALQAVGHPTDKVELLILGGTWSSYRRDYREWFILRCFDALNGVDSATLEEAHTRNETAAHRNVGLVIETRPDHVTPAELAHLRALGVTKVQLGAQSLDDEILRLNQRGHTVEETRAATALLRAAGFKIVLHWMPNLYGATLASDRADFSRLWDGFCPDELKIYPNQLLQNTELYSIWQQSLYTPYTTEELIDLLAEIKTTIPRYCRVNRVIRDIPSTNVVQGNKRTSLRQDVHAEMKRRGTRCQCVRCREVRDTVVALEELHREDVTYTVGDTEEHFLSFVTPDDKLAGFLRLSLPGVHAPDPQMEDLRGAAIIREVHVYGQSLAVGAEKQGAAQHIGLGGALIAWAQSLSAARGFSKLAVIAAVGTRGYYARHGFKRGALYMVKEIEV